MSIPISHIELLSRWYRPICAAGSGAGSDGGWVHELTRGSELVPIAPVTKRKSPEFEAFLAKMRARAEKREYDGMVKNLRPKDTIFDTLSGGAIDATPSDSHVLRTPNTSGGGSGGAAARAAGINANMITRNPLREAAVGMNVIIVMITGFVVFWYAGKQFFHAEPNSIKPVITGVCGLVAAMILEVTLLIVRDQKQQLHNARKLAAAGETTSTPAGGIDSAVQVMSGEITRPKPQQTTTATTPDMSGVNQAIAAAGGDANNSADDAAGLKRRSTKQSASAASSAAFEPLSFSSKKSVKAS